MNRLTWMVAVLAFATACNLAGLLGAGSLSAASPSSPTVAAHDSAGSAPARSEPPNRVVPAVTTTTIADYKVEAVAFTSCDGIDVRATSDELQHATESVARAAIGMIDATTHLAYGLGNWYIIYSRADAEQAISALEQAVAADQATLRSYLACKGWDPAEAERFQRDIAEHDARLAEIAAHRTAYFAKVEYRRAELVRSEMEQRAGVLRNERCSREEPRIYFAWRDPSDGLVRYDFCDAVVVERSPNGKLVSQLPDLEVHPAFRSFTWTEGEILDDARRRLKVLGAGKAEHDEVELAEKAFGAKVQQFVDKYYPERRYFDLVKKSKIEVVTAGK